VFVVLTDGETRAYGEAAVARRLRSAGIGLVLVHVWREGERLEAAYRPDPASGAALRDLAAAAGGTAVEEGDRGRAVAAARDALGTGPTEARSTEERVHPLAPWIALAALLPLAFGLWRRPAAGGGK
jgi:hypothetical protein